MTIVSVDHPAEESHTTGSNLAIPHWGIALLGLVAIALVIVIALSIRKLFNRKLNTKADQKKSLHHKAVAEDKSHLYKTENDVMVTVHTNQPYSTELSADDIPKRDVTEEDYGEDKVIISRPRTATSRWFNPRPGSAQSTSGIVIDDPEEMDLQGEYLPPIKP